MYTWQYACLVVIVVPLAVAAIILFKEFKKR